MPPAQYDSKASEFERLSAMTLTDLAAQVKQSLSGRGTLPTVHVSLGQAASDVWVSLLEESDPESPFVIRTRQVLSELLGELLQTDPIPAWAEGFCELLRRVGGPATFDALRTFVLREVFRHERYRASDRSVDRLLLEIAATRMRTDSETDFWPGLLKDERYCDIAHMALSVNMKQSIRHLQAAALALKKHPHRQRALVWVTLDRWLNQTSDADALSSELWRHLPWNSQVRRLINEWARKRDITGFELPPGLEERIERTLEEAAGSLTDRLTYGPLEVQRFLVLEVKESGVPGLGAYVLGPAKSAQMLELLRRDKPQIVTYIGPEAKEKIGLPVDS